MTRRSLDTHGEIIIIIITNEKIKVMLSRKRCRGTLQDYNKGEISKCQSHFKYGVKSAKNAPARWTYTKCIQTPGAKKLCVIYYMYLERFKS